MNVDEMVATFREKYPGSTAEQVEFYRQACLAEQANPPKPEPDLPMPVITVPAPPSSPAALNTYTAPVQFYAPQLDSPPSAPAQGAGDLREDLKRILLNSYGRRMSPAMQHRIRTENLSESQLLEQIFYHS